MDRRIAGVHQDEEIFWVAESECGHNQHVRHRPTMVFRPWVNHEQGRKGRLGTFLACKALATPNLQDVRKPARHFPRALSKHCRLPEYRPPAHWVNHFGIPLGSDLHLHKGIFPCRGACH